MIRRDLLPLFGVQELVVNDWLASWPEDIACTEDDEAILVCNQPGPLPPELIERIMCTDDSASDGAG